MSTELQHIADIPAYIFGDQSTLGSEIVASSQGAYHPQGLGLIALVVASLLVYLMWLNHWGARGENHRTLFELFYYFNRDYSSKYSEINPSFPTYINTGSWIGFTTIWIGAISFMTLSASNDIKIYIAIFAGIIATYLYQTVIISLIGRVVESKEFSKMVLHIKGTAYTMVGIIALPTVLCYCLASGEKHNIFMYITAFQGIIILSIFLYKTFILFISKKVSVLHTILYLCAVEIFPLSLAWGFFYR